MIRIAICDDDAGFAEKLRILTEDGLSALGAKPVVSVFGDSRMFLCDSSKYDAVFLDIDMPQVSGFEIAGRMNGRDDTLIVFVTMHDELVYSSIRFQPFRFVRKSCMENELPEVFDALKQKVRKRDAGKRFVFQTKNGEVFLDVRNIEYIEIYGHWLHVRVHDGEDLQCYGSLSDLEQRLELFDFIRVHKSYLVNCRYIYAIEKRQIILDDKTEILLSRYRVNEVRNKLRSFIRSEL